MLIYFIHGVATRDASYANKLIKLIEEECKRKNQAIPYCYAGFWGNVLKGTEKLWVLGKRQQAKGKREEK